MSAELIVPLHKLHWNTQLFPKKSVFPLFNKPPLTPNDVWKKNVKNEFLIKPLKLPFN